VSGRDVIVAPAAAPWHRCDPMANHGDRADRAGLPLPARVRAPAPPPRPPPPPIQAEVSLQAPRPDGDRVVNEYVETPLRAGAAPTAPLSAVSALPARRLREPHRHSVTLPVRQQPSAFKKEPIRSQPPAAVAPSLLPPPAAGLGVGAAGLAGLGLDDSRTSIICPACQRCRCDACQEPRALPSRWLCSNSCLCSAETAVDYASCLCCVKGLLYHCGNGEGEGERYADDPCSCSPAGPGAGPAARRLARWCCLGAATIVMPCLLCYWPLRALLRVCEACYSRCTSSGCRCRPHGAAAAGLASPPASPATPPSANASPASASPASSHHGLDKRLLDGD